jgi:DNA-binding beta-propeller fold protein YncE
MEGGKWWSETPVASPKAKNRKLTVLDAAKIQEESAAILGSIPAGALPREMAVSSDGRTLFLTNFASQSLQVIDIARLPISPARR